MTGTAANQRITRQKETPALAGRLRLIVGGIVLAIRTLFALGVIAV
ncbi:hypothetical protein [Methylocaldum sp.]|nr:hypothetical protein [Methylocaldum sp.]HYE33809.1 hypothetical protein [Methylocaldum sp.]